MVKRNDKKAVKEVSIVEDVNVDVLTKEVVKTNEKVKVLTDDKKSEEIGGQGVVEHEAVVDNEIIKEDKHLKNSKTDFESEETVEGLNDKREREPVQVSSPISNVFRSDSEEARYYIMELLSDKGNHKKQEIVTYINEKAGKKFSDSVIINTLRKLVNSGELMQLERGSYQSGSGIGLASKLLLFITNTKQGLDKITTMSLSEIKAEDLVVIDDVKKLKGMLNSIYEKLGTN